MHFCTNRDTKSRIVGRFPSTDRFEREVWDMFGIRLPINIYINFNFNYNNIYIYIAFGY